MKQDPMHEWVLKDEILVAFHQWPIIIAFVLGGSLLGLLFAFVWPSSYKVSTEISVNLNPYRALDDRYISEFASVEFRNIDDYKHWQMSQLSILVNSDDYLEETLNRLRKKDTYWQDINIPELRDMVEAQWRNAGRWLLDAEADTSQQAKDAVEVWQGVIIEKTSEATAQSKELFKLELVMRSLNNELVKLQTQQKVLGEIRSALDGILIELNGASPDEPMTQIDRLRLSTLVSQAADFNLGWEALISSFPEAYASTKEYITWIEQVNAAIEADLESIESIIEDLEGELSGASATWEAALQDAQGLSATLSVEKLSNETPEVHRVRSTGLAILVGGVVGLLVWLLVFLARITRKGYR